MQHGGAAAIGEGAAVAGVEVAFGRQALGEQHVVRWQFDVPVGHFVRRLLRDGRVIDQIADRDQHAVEEHGVIG